MTTSLDGRIAIITGATRGLGREYAEYFADHGARVVVSGRAPNLRDVSGPNAAEIASDIRARGGQAVHSYETSYDWEGGRRLVQAAVEAFGDLDVLVNNVGNQVDVPLLDMTEDDWDSVIAVHLRSTFVMTVMAGRYWRDGAAGGKAVGGRIVNTTSRVGLIARHGPVGGRTAGGMASYAVAKSGIATFSEVAARELAPLGVQVNCVAPSARTGMVTRYGQGDVSREDPLAFDEWNPRNISPLVAWLSTEQCPVSGRTYWIKGGSICVLDSWDLVERLERPGPWTMDELAEHAQVLGRGRPPHPDLVT